MPRTVALPHCSPEATPDGRRGRIPSTELVGGCDIITEMFGAGELETLLVETSEKYPAEG